MYKTYMLGLLTVILIFNYIDRFALGIVLQDIKTDLALSDTQLGLLSGIAFALFYSVMGIPIARWADRGNRVTIVSATAALWSVAVAMCGAAGSFLQLLLIRVGVAVGEAGCIPPAFSLIADHFNRAERPRAAAIYGIGGPISIIVGFFGAGWLNQTVGWRLTFLLLGAPGLLLALLAWLTLKEPRQTVPPIALATPEVLPGKTEETPAPSLPKVCVILWTTPTFRRLLCTLAVMFFFTYGILQWLPTLIVRRYGLSTGEVGTWLAIAVGVGGLVGSLLGGELASRYAANDERLQLRALACAVAASGVLSTIAYLSSPLHWLLGLVGLFFMMKTSINGPLFAVLQTLVPERIRASAFAIVYLFANLIGMGLGPLAVGALSDVFHPWAGNDSIRFALLSMTPGYLAAVWLLWRASRSVSADLVVASTGAAPRSSDSDR